MRRLLVPIAAAALVAAACTGPDTATDTPPTAPAPSPTATSPGPTSPETEAEPMDDTVRFVVRVENATDALDLRAVGVFSTPEGGSGPGPALPGGSYAFDLTAAPGDRLSFATMFVQSNDLVLATPPGGIALYDGDAPIDGEVQVAVWDVGTEADQPLGEGTDQAPRQSGPDTGADDPDPRVRRVEPGTAGLPPMSELAAVTVKPTGDGTFRVTIRNATDTSMGLQSPFAPGVFVVHGDGEPLFTEGEPDRGVGLEALAEDGDPTVLAARLSDGGVTSPIAPGVWVLDGEEPLFTEGAPDRGVGLEALAEDGDPSRLVDALDPPSGAFAIPDGAEAPAPAFPGDAYVFTVEAAPGDLLSVATMLVQSNDRFFAIQGLPLFDGDTPFEGTVDLTLWDAGTEVDQPAGTGPDQAPRQAGPDTGETQNGPVTSVPGTGVRLVITPQP